MLDILEAFPYRPQWFSVLGDGVGKWALVARHAGTPDVTGPTFERTLTEGYDVSLVCKVAAALADHFGCGWNVLVVPEPARASDGPRRIPVGAPG